MSIHDRDREQVFAESVAVANAGSDDQVRAWLAGLNERERATFDAMMADLTDWFTTVGEIMRETAERLAVVSAR